MNYLEEYYNNYNEEGRLLSQHGQVEYITTQKYIHDCIREVSAKRILEIGAGTGRYSIALAREGFDVTAVELIPHNIDLLKQKLNGTEQINVLQGNALDLSCLEDNCFDITLVLGPMYHLYSKQEKVRALGEAVRVTRPGGYILTAYCMNEPTVIQYVFAQNKLSEILDFHMLTDDWHCISEPKDLFELIRTEEIEELDQTVCADRIRLVATDGATNYMRSFIDGMDTETFMKWMEYHFTICERQDLIGASHHTLDILRKQHVSVPSASEEVVIREACMEDAEAFRALCYEEMGYDCSTEQIMDNIQKLQPETEKVFAAVFMGNVVGFIHVEKYQVLYSEPMANILGLAVRNQVQHHGIGTRLICAAENWAKDSGISMIRLNSGSERTGAHAFYRTLGYKDSKEQLRFIKKL